MNGLTWLRVIRHRWPRACVSLMSPCWWYPMNSVSAWRITSTWQTGGPNGLPNRPIQLTTQSAIKPEHHQGDALCVILKHRANTGRTALDWVVKICQKWRGKYTISEVVGACKWYNCADIRFQQLFSTVITATTGHKFYEQRNSSSL